MAAALRLRDRGPEGTTVTVYEQSGAVGGKLSTGEVAGSAVELGAEAFLVRDPDGGDSAAVALARRVGLGDALVHPATGQAALALHGTLTPMPGGTLLGVPADLEKVAAVARPDADLDRDGGRPLLGPGRMSRSGRSCGGGWATRSSTGWSTPCSAACTRGGPTRSRWPRRCLASPGRRGWSTR
ncbi:hypothetical protein Phou_018940 [Phytohabitans houttuyneae]|uniref:Amine oxidase domain-containing protein n=1 Tax=Phytohabitans houttuyneae TaxID=1076126 RepID=A0A6V8K1Y9_9ACTN|nr:hypothetical protein Phou_018940 [Phytohabitans houttuyneae]